MSDVLSNYSKNTKVDKLIGELDTLVHGFNPFFWLPRNIVDTTTTLATSKARITYSIYPKYEQLERVCGNCKHSQETPTETWCLNLDTESFIEGGMNKPILKPAEWSCPLWEESESDGMGE